MLDSFKAWNSGSLNSLMIGIDLKPKFYSPSSPRTMTYTVEQFSSGFPNFFKFVCFNVKEKSKQLDIRKKTNTTNKQHYMYSLT